MRVNISEMFDSVKQELNKTTETRELTVSEVQKLLDMSGNELKRVLKTLSAAHGVSLSKYVNTIIIKHIESLVGPEVLKDNVKHVK